MKLIDKETNQVSEAFVCGKNKAHPADTADLLMAAA
jgi:hypothetical protein